MIRLLYLLFSSLLIAGEVPVGTPVHIRLTSTVASYASKAGSPVSAVLIAPLAVDNEIAIPAGTVISGDIKSVKRVGLGFLHETATLDLDFNRLTLSDGQTLPLSAQVKKVDNGRERVTRKGEIRGIRTTGSISYRVSGYVRTLILWYVHAEFAEWLIRSLIVQVPEPEIYYPPGVELTLSLTAPLLSAAPVESAHRAATLDSADRAAMEELTASLPDRTYTVTSNRPSDLINILLIGSRDEISAAFEAAGWVEARPRTLGTGIRGIRAVIENRGYRFAPMSRLTVNETPADMSWEKSFNDFAKRHHIRVWKQPQKWHGREIWIGAATHDIDFAYLRPGQAVTHRVDPDVDLEREKVANDLAFTSCVALRDSIARPDVPRTVWNATGDFMATDTRLAVIGLNECRTPRLSTETADLEPPPAAHGNGVQRFVRREVLSARSDLLRTNIYWRTYEGVRWMVEAIRQHRQRAALQVRMTHALAPTVLQKSAAGAASRPSETSKAVRAASEIIPLAP
ncbi:MAG TPA: LssY C-terminal domain-containing protein [Bryobacteraceae bacterium]|nr:LssY C-terminal domain-containing protein [Bryobacteraceae bacterium]